MNSMAFAGRLMAAFALVAAVAEGEVLWKNGEWEFLRDGKSMKVELPHDWAIAGPFDPNQDGGSGKLPWKGKGEYRRSFEVEGFAASRAEGARYYLEFDGVMARPEVLVNGIFAGGWDYGYMGFQLDVTELLREGTNRVAVKCDTSSHRSRWYPGAGIYREVRFVRRGRDHVIPGSLAITTPKVSKASATVHVVYDSPVKGHVEFDRTITNPRLWDVDDPFLYELEILGERFRYGIRTFEFTADDGFHLNGRRVQLKGVDLHSDMGPLGMAFDRDVMKRQLLVMKDMGANALRTSHNAPDPKVLELCDELGIVVWNECFDKWDATAGRRPDENLEAYVVRNLRQFVRRDRNHPSVFVWSIGNEIPPNGYGWKGADPKQTSGMSAERFREFRAAIRELDPTRPVGIGCCHGNAIASGMFAELDISGWNYGANYRRVKARHPAKPCVYTESASALSDYGYYGREPAKAKVAYDFQEWKVCGYDHCAASWSDIPDVEFDRMETDRYCAGEFVWTGIDYLGEPTPLWAPGQQGVPEGTPYSLLARSSYFGIVDLMGVPKDRYYLYRAYWNHAVETVHVLPHWNWAGREGEKVPVYVYTSGDEAELFLNGRSLGRRRKITEAKRRNLASGAKVAASSEQIQGEVRHLAADAIDGRHESRWCASSDATNEWWQIDFGKVTAFKSISIEFEQSQVRYEIKVMLSDDGDVWREHFHKPLRVDAGVIVKSAAARFIRVEFKSMQFGVWASIERVFVSDEEERNPYYDVCGKYRLRWFDVPYEPGEIKAVAYRAGVKIGEETVRTAGSPVAVRLTENKHNAPEARTRFFEVDLVDERGVRDPLCTRRVNFELEGPGEIVAVGNGDPRGFDSFKQVSSHPLYYGKAVVVVRRRGAGEIWIKAAVPGLKSAEHQWR